MSRLEITQIQPTQNGATFSFDFPTNRLQAAYSAWSQSNFAPLKLEFIAATQPNPVAAVATSAAGDASSVTLPCTGIIRDANPVIWVNEESQRSFFASPNNDRCVNYYAIADIVIIVGSQKFNTGGTVAFSFPAYYKFCPGAPTPPDTGLPNPGEPGGPGGVNTDTPYGPVTSWQPLVDVPDVADDPCLTPSFTQPAPPISTPCASVSNGSTAQGTFTKLS